MEMPINSKIYIVKRIFFDELTLSNMAAKKICDRLAVADVRVKNEVSSLTSIPYLSIKYGARGLKKDAKKSNEK